MAAIWLLLLLLLLIARCPAAAQGRCVCHACCPGAGELESQSQREMGLELHRTPGCATPTLPEEGSLCVWTVGSLPRPWTRSGRGPGVGSWCYSLAHRVNKGNWNK